MYHYNDNNDSPREKLRDRLYRKPWRTLLYSFLGTLALLLISWITGIRGGYFAIISYPISLPFFATGAWSYWLEKTKNGGLWLRGDPGLVIFLWSLPVVFFVLDLLGVPL